MSAQASEASSSAEEVPRASNLVRDRYAAQIAGKTVLVTGVSAGGLGAHFAGAVAGAPPAHAPRLLILAGRSEARVEATRRDLAARFPHVRTRALRLDLASLADVRRAAADVDGWADVPAVDVLVLNAGVMAVPYARTADGFEMQFGANYVGHWLFANLLMHKVLAGTQVAQGGDGGGSGGGGGGGGGDGDNGRMSDDGKGEGGGGGGVAADGGRIVSVASDGFLCSPIRFDDPGFDGGACYNPWRAYGQSKTANTLHAVALAARLAHRGLSAFSLHPGVIMNTSLAAHFHGNDNSSKDDNGHDKKNDTEETATDTATNTPSEAGTIGKYKDMDEAFQALFKLDREQGHARATAGFKPISADQGVATHVFAAFDPRLSSRSPANGALCWEARVSRPDEVRAWARDPVEAARLWTLTEELVGQKFDWS